MWTILFFLLPCVPNNGFFFFFVFFFITTTAGADDDDVEAVAADIGVAGADSGMSMVVSTSGTILARLGLLYHSTTTSMSVSWTHDLTNDGDNGHTPRSSRDDRTRCVLSYRSFA